MPAEYEVVGYLDEDVAGMMELDSRTILVEHDDPSERLVCRPKDANGGEPA